MAFGLFQCVINLWNKTRRSTRVSPQKELLSAFPSAVTPASHINRRILTTNEYSLQPIMWKPFSRGTNRIGITIRGSGLFQTRHLVACINMCILK